jgi:hypothetical protein
LGELDVELLAQREDLVLLDGHDHVEYPVYRVQDQGAERALRSVMGILSDPLLLLVEPLVTLESQFVLEKASDVPRDA